VACHWAEQIFSGELAPHTVNPTATNPTLDDDAPDDEDVRPQSEAEVS
jgi:hypothetical protein